MTKRARVETLAVNEKGKAGQRCAPGGNRAPRRYRPHSGPGGEHHPARDAACLRTGGSFRVKAVQFRQRDHRTHILSIPEFPRAGHFQLLEGVLEDRAVELFAVAPDFHRIGAVHMDEAAKVAQHALQALGAAEGLLARFIGLLRPPGDRIQADGTARLVFLAADGGFEFGAQLPGSGSKTPPQPPG